MRANPVYITEYNVGDDSEIPVSDVLFWAMVGMFERDPDYSIKEWTVPGGKVVATFYMANGNPSLSTYFWHVPDEYVVYPEFTAERVI
ncbi:hypothetical protein [Alkalihalobacillus sp. TS-13]|uniref:hypothetical protein n=1 Tax=Alkalihalobacillus sp. TS-13 TaxID=2842455 RepID=UPI001C86D5E8|nr:hypothetical protein [Alkalihalobacillus sp. TS-13]